MARDTAEWRGKDDNTPAPDRVRVRLFLRAKGRCEKCTKAIFVAETWDLDHRVSLINGGENREGNLQVLCCNCHKTKTAGDVAEKAEVYASRKRHLGLKKPKGRPMPGTRRSGIRKRLSGKVEKWI